MSGKQWTEAQSSIFAFDSSTAVSAGAGSGKTAAMVELYLRLVTGEVPGRAPVPPARMVAITFTEKAAWEMRERIRREAAARAPDGARGKLSRDLESGVIGTIHGFAAQLLREFPVEAGVDPAFGVLAEEEASRLLEESAAAALFERLAAHDADAEALVAALPLSGGDFTRGLFDHLVRIHASVRGLGFSIAGLDANHDAVCAAARDTLSRQLANALRDAADTAIANGKGKAKAYGENLAAALGACGELVPAEPEALAARLAELDALMGGTWSGDGVSAAKKEAREAIDATRALVHAVSGSGLVRGFARLLEDLETRYAREKRRLARLDFEDLQLLLRDLLDTHGWVADELRARFAVVMVDEFQDTNRLQWDLVRRLCQAPGSAADAPPVRGKLFVVGDPKQSIYGFRGAEVGVFRGVMDHARAEGRVVHLADNFRSTAPLLAFVNELFADLMRGPDVTFGPGDHLLPHREAAGPAVEILELPDPDGADHARRLEARALARRMREAADQGVRWGEMALLLRRFTRLAIYQEELRRADVPFHVVKGRGFYRCAEVADLHHLLRLILRPASPLALVALLRSPLVALSDETILYLFIGPDGKRRSRPEAVLAGGLPDDVRAELARAVASGASLLTSHDLERELERADRFTRVFRGLQAGAETLGAAALVRRAVEELALDATLLTQFQGEQKLANVRKLTELLTSLEEQGSGTLAEVVARLGRLLEEDPREAEAQLVLDGLDAVHVMTIHQSKGLEFPYVMLGELSQAATGAAQQVSFDPELGLAVKPRDPATRRPADTPVSAAVKERVAAREIAESQRLLYVAMTRARDRLVIVDTPPARSAKNTWRTWLEERRDALAAHVTRRQVPASELEPALREPRRTPYAGALAAVGALSALTGGAAPRPPAVTLAAASAVERAFASPATHAGRLTLTVTDLSELATCPRRHAFAYRLGLEEPPFPEPGAPEGHTRPRKRGAPGEGSPPEPRSTRLHAGTLIHALLERADPRATSGARRAQLIAAAEEAGPGLDPALLALAVDDAARLLDGAFGDRLRAIAPERVLREHPFVCQVPDLPHTFLRGQIDVVLLEDAGPLVIDYKYQSGEPGEASGHRFQLACYAFALQSSKLGGAAPIRAGIQFMRGDQPFVELAAGELDLPGVPRRIAELSRDLAAPGGAPQLAELPVKEASACVELRCGFFDRCHPRVVAPPGA